MTQETDRELLELAAKAAGFDVHGFFGDDETGEWWADIGEEEVIQWNPLTDDGDALRLAEKLRINIIFSGPRHYIGLDRHPIDICCLGGMDAIRYGIVRVAAKIGKAM